MQIVIEIDDDVYERIKKRESEPNDAFYCYDSVLYGITLPKNHGRLIDANKLHMDYCNDNCGERKCVDAMDRCVFIDAVINAPTIIEEVKADDE